MQGTAGKSLISIEISIGESIQHTKPVWLSLTRSSGFVDNRGVQAREHEGKKRCNVEGRVYFCSKIEQPRHTIKEPGLARTTKADCKNEMSNDEQHRHCWEE